MNDKFTIHWHNGMLYYLHIDIEIDEEQLAELPLTRVPMKVVREHDAIYRDVVPEFPIITNDDRLIYFQQSQQWRTAE